MSAIQSFYNQCSNHFGLLNTANIVLLPKKEGAERISDFRPISLIHAVAKIITKVIALRLQPHMNQLVSYNQSAFIKKRAIHDNFLYVRNLARLFHPTHTPSLLFKLDIAKAFDSVQWDYLLDLLQRRGFPSRWRNCLTSSQVLINGVPGSTIQHGKGLGQGDPLSPLLFVIAIDPLVKLLDLATQNGWLAPL
jgi:retron-type reverse transcriptase